MLKIAGRQKTYYGRRDFPLPEVQNLTPLNGTNGPENSFLLFQKSEKEFIRH